MHLFDESHSSPVTCTFLDGGGSVMVIPWLAVIDLGGRSEEVTRVVESLRSLGVPLESITPDVRVETLRHGRPVLALAHTATLSLDTLDLLRWLGQEDIPTAVVGDRLTEEDELILLHSGAWLTFTPPFSPRLLSTQLITLHAHLARTSRLHAEVHRIKNLTVNVRRREVSVDNVLVPLTKTEFQLLLTLTEDPTSVVTREQLLHVPVGLVGSRSLESHLSRLRRKITDAGGPPLIHAVRGVGYRLDGE